MPSKPTGIAYLLKPLKLTDLQAALAKLRFIKSEVEIKKEEVAAANRESGAASEEETKNNAEFLLPNSSLMLERLLDMLPRPTQPFKSRFLVRQGESLLPLPATEVAWFQSRHETVTLATLDGRRFVIDYTLEQLENLLDPALFSRLNRQVLAQLPAVRRLLPHLGGKLLVELNPAPTGDVLVSKERAASIKNWLEG